MRKHNRQMLFPEPCSESLPLVLDVCCGSRGIWFDRNDYRSIYMDRRRETLTEIHSRGNEKIIIDPDIIADFTRLPFLDNSFVLVVMDPPHVPGNTITGNITKRYGILRGDWKEMLRQGFAECFRVLKPHGTFILKWSSVRVPLKEILPLAKPQKPLFGSLSGLKMNTYWVAFLKRQIEREL